MTQLHLKLSIAFLITIGGLFFIYQNIDAHPGGTDSSGCHTCRTNCPSWGLSYGEYHCHQSRGLPQPESPITCSYGIGCEYAPQYESPNYSFPSTPSCPFNSYYDSLSGKCKCSFGYVASDSGDSCISTDEYCRNSLGWNGRYNILTDNCECGYGYILSGGECVSEDDYCEDLLGFNAEYNTLTDSCSCRYGYVLDGSSCVSGSSSCWNKYGYNSSYNSLSKGCECGYGYVWNTSKTSCISEDEMCEDLIGYNSSYNSLTDSCECSYGYVLNDSKTDCIGGNSYCSSKYGFYSEFNTLTKSCECESGYTFRDGECVEEIITYFQPPVLNIHPVLPSLPQVSPPLPQNFSNTTELNKQLQSNQVVENIPKVQKQETKPAAKEDTKVQPSNQTASISSALTEKEETKPQPKENRVTGFFKRVFKFLFRR